MDLSPPISEDLWNRISADVQAALRTVLDTLEARIAKLEEANPTLQARPNQNSSNSSKPPSSDPPSVKRAPPRPPSGKKRGGQPGHPRHERALVDTEDIRDCKPTHCRNCCRPLTGEDEQPLRL